MVAAGDRTGGTYTKAVDWWSLGILMYRLLVGEYPFRSILDLGAPVNYEVKCFTEHPDLVDFISKLLEVQDTSRLGFGDDGAANICAHEFFSGIDWVKLDAKKLQPPPLLVCDLPMSSDFPKYNSMYNLLYSHFKSDWLRVGKSFTSADSAAQAYFVSWEYVSKDALAHELMNTDYWNEFGSYDPATATTNNKSLNSRNSISDN
jgi:serine/threonine protein kinase